MIWLLLLHTYEAPADAVDWNGPWKLGDTRTLERKFESEGECRNTAIQLIGRLHQGMMVPFRFDCVRVQSTLPEGATR